MIRIHPQQLVGGGGNNGILYSNSPVGSILPYAVNDSLPDGYLICNGAEVLTDEYPELFSVIGDTFGTASDEFHFVLPDLRDKFIEGSNTAGTSIDAGLPNIKGDFGSAVSRSVVSLNTPSTGALISENYAQISTTSGTASAVSGFDASLSNPIYSDDVDTVQPPAITMIYIIKAINTIEIFENIQDENYTIIYPNNGTEESPAIVNSNTIYIEDNPFPGYEVECKAELYVNGCWGHMEWVSTSTSNGGWAAFGIVSHKDDNGNIRIITGANGVLDGHDKGSSHQINGHTFTNMASSWSLTTSAPCRIKVWKVNAINNTPVVKKTEVNVNRVDYAEGQSWCYIYPNNGTKESPANIVNNTRYVLENPFPGYLVQCIVYLLYDNNWFEPSYPNLRGTDNTGYGTKASLFNESQIIVQTGSAAVDFGGKWGGSGLGSTPYSTNPTFLPCRVLVCKIGKLSE